MKVFALTNCEPYYRGDPESVHETFESAKAAVSDDVRGWYRDDRQSTFNVAKAKVRGSDRWWEIREFEVQS